MARGHEANPGDDTPSPSPRAAERRPVRGLLQLVLAALAIGLLGTSLWLVLGDLGDLRAAAARLDLRYVPLLVLLVLASIGLRFLRWTFLLRRIRAFVPLRENLRIFLAGFSMILTPLSVGEVLKAFLLRARSRTPIRQGVSVVIAERLFDVCALLVILALARGQGLGLLLALVLAVPVGAWLVGTFLDVPAGGDHPVRGGFLELLRALRPAAFVAGLLLSVAAWLCAALVLHLSLVASGAGTAFSDAAAAFSLATPLGALTFVPGGTGVTGGLMLQELESLGAPAASATVAVVVARACTYWFTAGLGIWFLLSLRRARPGLIQQGAHFEELASEYAEELPEHVRLHVLGKKVGRMRPWLAELRSAVGRPLLGLDVGCGHAWYAAALADEGRMLGADVALGQLREARRHLAERGEEVASRVRLVQANGMALPFASETLDFASCINILHHVEEPGGQRRALDEMTRCLRVGGRLFLHEVNVSNPLFRFYMGYVFPLLNDIDLGTERWLPPGKLHVPAGAVLERVEYFTFLPDFLPAPALRGLAWLERLLELSPLRKGSAHYMAVYRRTEGGTPGGGAPGPAKPLPGSR